MSACHPVFSHKLFSCLLLALFAADAMQERWSFIYSRDAKLICEHPKTLSMHNCQRCWRIGEWLEAGKLTREHEGMWLWGYELGRAGAGNHTSQKVVSYKTWQVSATIQLCCWEECEMLTALAQISESGRCQEPPRPKIQDISTFNDENFLSWVPGQHIF